MMTLGEKRDVQVLPRDDEKNEKAEGGVRTTSGGLLTKTHADTRAAASHAVIGSLLLVGSVTRRIVAKSVVRAAAESAVTGAAIETGEKATIWRRRVGPSDYQWKKLTMAPQEMGIATGIRPETQSCPVMSRIGKCLRKGLRTREIGFKVWIGTPTFARIVAHETWIDRGKEGPWMLTVLPETTELLLTTLVDPETEIPSVTWIGQGTGTRRIGPETGRPTTTVTCLGISKSPMMIVEDPVVDRPMKGEIVPEMDRPLKMIVLGAENDRHKGILVTGLKSKALTDGGERCNLLMTEAGPLTDPGTCRRWTIERGFVIVPLVKRVVDRLVVVGKTWVAMVQSERRPMNNALAETKQVAVVPIVHPNLRHAPTKRIDDGPSQMAMIAIADALATALDVARTRNGTVSVVAVGNGTNLAARHVRTEVRMPTRAAMDLATDPRMVMGEEKGVATTGVIATDENKIVTRWAYRRIYQ
jgi:hypothetical protein